MDDAEKRAGRWSSARQEAARERGYRRAATKADIQLRPCKQQEHGYLKDEGFVHELGMVDADDTLHIPMRDWQTNHLRGTPAHFMGRRIVAEEDDLRHESPKAPSSGLEARGRARHGLRRVYANRLSALKPPGYEMRINAAVAGLFRTATCACSRYWWTKGPQRLLTTTTRRRRNARKPFFRNELPVDDG